MVMECDEGLVMSTRAPSQQASPPEVHPAAKPVSPRRRFNLVHFVVTLLLMGAGYLALLLGAAWIVDIATRQ